MFNLVIATKNRPLELERLFRSLALEGNYSELLKVVVVDQSNTDIFNQNSVLIHHLFEKRKKLEVIHINDENTGLSKARNKGLTRIADQGYLCFPDDDCWYPESFFLQMREQFEKTHATFLLTYYREEFEDRPELKGNYKVTWLNLKKTAFNSVSIFIDLSKVDKKDLYFDESIGAGTSLPYGEDNLFSYRIFSRYGNTRKISDPYVYHPVIRNDRPDYEKSALASSYVNLHSDLGVFFKTFFLLSLIRTALRSFFSPRDKVILKGKVEGLLHRKKAKL